MPKDGKTIGPDHIYIIAPDKEISVFNGKLQLLDVLDKRPTLSIDAFLESLARDQGPMPRRLFYRAPEQTALPPEFVFPTGIDPSSRYKRLSLFQMPSPYLRRIQGVDKHHDIKSLSENL